MIFLHDRRSMAFSLVKGSLIALQLDPYKRFPPDDSDLKSIPKLAGFLTERVPQEFLQAVQSSGGRFLYRGDEKGLRSPPPDLLDWETYQDNAALEYFVQLEERLTMEEKNPTFVAKPSNGHIGTSDPFEAAKWGNVVSIWPLLDGQGAQFSYVWPLEDTVFFNGTTSAANNELVVHDRLEQALAEPEGREVLFATNGKNPSSFLAIPMEWDGTLRAELEKVHYGISNPNEGSCRP